MADITRTAAQIAPVYSDAGKCEVYDLIAAATIAAGQAVYIDSDGAVGLADANGTGTREFRGIALNGAGAGQAVSVLVHGCIYGFTLDGNADAFAYLSNTAGAIADTASVGGTEVRVGRIVRLSDASATKVLFVDVRWNGNWA